MIILLRSASITSPFLSPPLGPQPKGFLSVESPIVFDALLTLGEQVVKLTRAEITELFLLMLIERHDCGSYLIFRGGVSARFHPFIDEFLHVRIQ
jgi:hypothetical protein